MPAPDAVSLTATNIHLAFGPNKVLRGVDLDVPAGTTTAVIGPSGSGKSTLLRTLNRLYEPDEGDVLLDGRSVLRDNPDQLRQRIGMVFQQFNLFPTAAFSTTSHWARAGSKGWAPTTRANWVWRNSTGLGCGTRPMCGLARCLAANSSASRSPARSRWHHR